MSDPKMTRDYEPDPSRLRQIGQWQPLPQDAVWEDGSQLLVAVPIVGVTDWFYEYAVIEIKCDEDYFELKCNDEPWDWSWEDIDFYVQLSGSLPVSMETYLKNEGRFNE